MQFNSYQSDEGDANSAGNAFGFDAGNDNDSDDDFDIIGKKHRQRDQCERCGSTNIQETDDQAQKKCMDCHCVVASSFGATLEDQYQQVGMAARKSRMLGSAQKTNKHGKTFDEAALSVTEASHAPNVKRALKCDFKDEDDDD